jgi:hypothetical protein
MYASTAAELSGWKAKLEQNGGNWEGRLERVSRIMEDGSVEFDTSQKPNDVHIEIQYQILISKIRSHFLLNQ